MTETRPPAGLTTADYGLIEAAVKETARGRWFLAEHAKRNRHADTETILAALGRLERAVVSAGAGAAVERFETDLADMMLTIGALRRRLAGEGTAPGERTRDPLRAAVSDAHDAAAALGDAARDLRKHIEAVAASGADPHAVSALMRRATALGLVGELETLTARRLGWALDTLAHVEARLGALTSELGHDIGAGAALPAGPLIEVSLAPPAAGVGAAIPSPAAAAAEPAPPPRARYGLGDAGTSIMRPPPDPTRRAPTPAPRVPTMPPAPQPPTVHWERPKPPPGPVEPPLPARPRRPLTLDELAAMPAAERLKYFT